MRKYFIRNFKKNKDEWDVITPSLFSLQFYIKTKYSIAHSALNESMPQAVHPIEIRELQLIVFSTDQCHN